MESDRGDSGEIDPLASVRSGDDFEEDTNSKVSDYLQSGLLNQNTKIKQLGNNNNNGLLSSFGQTMNVAAGKKFLDMI